MHSRIYIIWGLARSHLLPIHHLYCNQISDFNLTELPIIFEKKDEF